MSTQASSSTTDAGPEPSPVDQVLQDGQAASLERPELIRLLDAGKSEPDLALLGQHWASLPDKAKGFLKGHHDWPKKGWPASKRLGFQIGLAQRLAAADGEAARMMLGTVVRDYANALDSKKGEKSALVKPARNAIKEYWLVADRASDLEALDLAEMNVPERREQFLLLVGDAFRTIPGKDDTRDAVAAMLTGWVDGLESSFSGDAAQSFRAALSGQPPPQKDEKKAAEDRGSGSNPPAASHNRAPKTYPDDTVDFSQIEDAHKLLGNAVRQFRKQRDQAREKLTELQAALDEAGTQRDELAGRVENLDAAIVHAESRTSAATEEAASANEHRNAVVKQLQDLQEQIENYRDQLEKQAGDLDEAKRRGDTLDAELSSAKQAKNQAVEQARQEGRLNLAKELGGKLSHPLGQIEGFLEAEPSAGQLAALRGKLKSVTQALRGSGVDLGEPQ